MKKPFVAAAVMLFLASPVEVSAETFPLTSGDISSAADWGGTLPGPDAHLAFNSGTSISLNTRVR